MLVRTISFQAKIRPALKPVKLSIRVNQMRGENRIQITE